MKNTIRTTKTAIAGSLLLCAVLFSSCLGVETPRLTKENPFIVTKIKVYDLENNAYTGGKFVDMFGQYWAYHQTIIAPRGMFQIGDTVKVCK